jgi:hypothetical protein
MLYRHNMNTPTREVSSFWLPDTAKAEMLSYQRRAISNKWDEKWRRFTYSRSTNISVYRQKLGGIYACQTERSEEICTLQRPRPQIA